MTTKQTTGRLNRELESREASERPKQWQPASALPEPDKQPGYVYRWIRVSTMNEADPRNVSSKFREGWEPVRIEEQPQFKSWVERNSRFEDGIEIGGLLLCKMPEEFVQQRQEYYANKNKAQIEAVDNNFMRENDTRMPLFSEKRTTVTFGKGN